MIFRSSVIALALAAVAAACVPVSVGFQPTLDPATTQLARIDAARATWTTSMGPRQAVEYARAVHDAVAAGAYRANPFRWGTDLPGAIQALDGATPTAGSDAGLLVAWRAVLLADNAQPDDAVREYERSLSIGPTYLAAAALAAYYGRSGRVDQVHAVCGATVPRLTDDSERFDLMSACYQASNALSEEAGLPWASPEQLAWYRGERARRQQAAVTAANATRQKEQSELRDRRDQMIVGKLCREECNEKAARCYAGCGDVARNACEYGCRSREDRCLRACE